MKVTSVKIVEGSEVIKRFENLENAETPAYQFLLENRYFIFDKRVDLDGSMVWYVSK